MEIKLSDHFTYRRLLRFVLPSIVMMIFTSIYGVVDGLFVSNFAGKTEFAAVNLIMPFPMLLGAFDFMIGTGGSAIVSQKLGEGKKDKANEVFSMLIKVTIVAGIILSVIGIIFTRQIAEFMGASDEMMEFCVMYGRILLCALTPFMLQNVFQSFLVTAERPGLGLVVTVAAGVTNIILDFLMIGVFKWGVVGAALATGISQLVGGFVPYFFFLKKNTNGLRIVKAQIDWMALLRTCTNGSSELMTNVSMSLVNMLYNYQLIKYAGENGVAAYGVIMYVNFIFVSIFIGYAIGTAPIVGYNYGAGNHKELKNVFGKSVRFNVVSGMIMSLLAITLSGVLAKIFVGYDKDLFDMTKEGFSIYSISFIMMGMNIFSSAFFTALGDGLISAAISFLRTLLFQVIAVLMLPVIFQLQGIWMAIVVAEACALVISIVFLVGKRKKYNY